jgi:hypothetical protein
MLSERCPVALCIASFLFLRVQGKTFPFRKSQFTFLSNSVAMPTVINAYPSSESEEFFQDNWDYKVGQSKTPLLQKLQQKNHTLPPTANETVGSSIKPKFTLKKVSHCELVQQKKRNKGRLWKTKLLTTCGVERTLCRNSNKQDCGVVNHFLFKNMCLS